MQFKRLLFQTHRWTGVVLALFMFIWFLSGLVIVYAPSTIQNRGDQLARAETLQPGSDWLPLGLAWTRAHTGSDPRASIVEGRLVQHLSGPAWLIEDSQGKRHAISAISGQTLRVSADEAVQIGARWLGRPDTDLQFLETFEHDATMRNQEALRPFHRLAVNDAAGTQLTISAHTGEVIRVADRIDRGLFWIGNWLHLFRPLDSLGWGESRRDVLLWVSGVTLLATLTGLIVGWLRWRPGWAGKPTYSEGRVHPYRVFWFRWHFWGGLIGGIAAFLWILSGFINNNPWQLFSSANANRQEINRFLGAKAPTALLDWEPGSVASLQPDTVELRWRRLGDDAILLAAQRDGTLQALDPATPVFSDAALLAAVSRLAGEVPIATHRLLTEYDSYYYPRHGRGNDNRPLPVLQVDLADAGATRLYIDPQQGRLLLKQDQSRRVYRWLFSALHYWDFGWLYARPLWDAWMLVWIGFGLVLSVSGLVLAWKRLALTFKPKRHSAAKAKGQKAPLGDLAAEQPRS